jgi:hypothetical protein
VVFTDPQSTLFLVALILAAARSAAVLANNSEEA